jgi:ketosteroid isomerase-like protein
MRKLLALAVVMSALLVACGPSGVKQAEYDRVASELAAAKQQVVDLQSKLSAAEQQVANAQSQLQQEVEADAWAAAWRQDFKAALEGIDVDKLLTFYTEDCQYQDPDWVSDGIDGIRSMVEGLNKSGDRIEIKSIFSGKDWAAVEAVWHTTHDGKQKHVEYAGIYLLKDGKISRERLYWETIGW